MENKEFVESEECLPLIVSELKSMYNRVEQMFDNLKNKFIFFSTGQMAFLAYLYGGSDGDKNQIERLFIPQELSSQIFYVAGIVLAVLSLVYLFQGFLPVSWELPPDSSDLKKSRFNDLHEFHVYLRDKYYNAYKYNSSVYESRNAVYKKGLVCFVIGNVILFIIRFFGRVALWN